MPLSLPLPPFGLVIEAYQKENIKLQFPIYICIGKDSFEQAKAYKSYGMFALCLPPHKAFTQYRWPVYQQNIVLIDTGNIAISDIRKFIFELLNQGACVVAIDSPQMPFQIFRK